MCVGRWRDVCGEVEGCVCREVEVCACMYYIRRAPRMTFTWLKTCLLLPLSSLPLFPPSLPSLSISLTPFLVGSGAVSVY